MRIDGILDKLWCEAKSSGEEPHYRQRVDEELERIPHADLMEAGWTP